MQSLVNTIVTNPPFTVVAVNRYTRLQSSIVLSEGEEQSDPISGWMVGYLMIYIALFVPMPLVTSSFAGENEKKTLEGILAMPMTHFQIILGKFLGAALLLSMFAFSNLVGVFLYNTWLEQSDLQGVLVNPIPVDPLHLIFLFIGVYLSSLVALALGISLTSTVKDVRTAELRYNLPILIPFAILAIATLIMEPGPYNVLFILPWMHSIAIVIQGSFPNSLLTETITGSYTGDILIHIAVLVFYIIISLGLAAFLSARGKLLTIGD